MSDHETSGGSGQFNITSVLAFVTVIASIFLVSNKLTSSRPVQSASSTDTLGDQKVGARLWEDPLKWRTNSSEATGWEIRAPEDDTMPTILAVMVSGGAYSEDKESRIRARYAVVSGLSESGYAPVDAEHIGHLSAKWPSESELNNDIWSTVSVPGSEISSERIQIAFEWFRPRVFHRGGSVGKGHVLVLWLTEESFAEAPLPRLALALYHLRSSADFTPTNIVVIGPRTSSSLRQMLPDYETGSDNLQSMEGAVTCWIESELGNVDLLLATPTAIDEVLVQQTSSAPRSSVIAALQPWFKTVRNIAFTDGELASTVFDELELRKIDVTDQRQHVVLISEWDSFFGRMMSLTYGAELALKITESKGPEYIQKAIGSNAPKEVTRLALVTIVRSNGWVPNNLHSFVYLRGLDGQTVGENAGAGSDDNRKPRPSSIEQIGEWKPDANKAEGPSQMDYLRRLGDQIEALDGDLKSTGSWCPVKGPRVAAIGIVGSDVYDSLLILQALRSRFPDCVFFTTDLDARLADPKEGEWAKNLVVVSGFGLQLHPDLQRNTPQFRDSSQTALFASTKIPLNANAMLYRTNDSPRRFEIGRNCIIDLSPPGSIHPSSRGSASLPNVRIAVGSLMAVCFTVFMIIACRPIRRVVCGWNICGVDTLWLREEDLGGNKGVALIIQGLAALQTVNATKLHKLLLANPKISASLSQPANGHTSIVQPVLDVLNSYLGCSGRKIDYRIVRKRRRRLECLINSALEKALTNEKDDQKRVGLASVVNVAKAAREASLDHFEVQHIRRFAAITAASVVAVSTAWLIECAYSDTYHRWNGEPISFLNGASAWPTEFIRWVIIVLSAVFTAEAYFSLRYGTASLSRRFRLTFTQPKKGLVDQTDAKSQTKRGTFMLSSLQSPRATVKADELWEQFQHSCSPKHRVIRCSIYTLLYLLFGIGIMSLTDFPYRPVRGDTLSVADYWLLAVSVISFLFVSFWTIDSAQLCGMFIERLSEAPTEYSFATRRHFAELRAVESADDVIEEWIDTQLIAELSEQIGRFLYFPFIICFVFVLSRIGWWDRWSWPPSLVAIFVCNLALAVASVAVLQRAARKARDIGIERLEAKLAAKQQRVYSEAAHTADTAQKLLDDVRKLKKGAFAPFWQNPIVGAILVPSSGTALIQLIVYLSNR